MNALKKAVFLDKDGTLIRNVPNNVSVDRIVFYEFVFDGLKLLRKHGYKLLIVSNQAGIALGLFDEKAFLKSIDFISSALLKEGVALDGYYYCPHSPQGVVPEYTKICDCKKPSDGLIRRAAIEHGIDLERSWMIGDILNDVEAGNRAGCRSILVDNNNETEWVMGGYRKPFAVTLDFYAAAGLIIETDNVHEGGVGQLQEGALHQAR
jgi:D-glycero-D-manno-heptose 1,7-bisphosphate phosphatase